MLSSNNKKKQTEIKTVQQITNKRSLEKRISLIKAKLDPSISEWINYIYELLNYDNTCIKLENQSYNIYIDSSKKQNKDWTIYPMLANHHLPIKIWQISKFEFETISDIYPKFRTQINKQINKNSKNDFLSNRITPKNIIDSIN